MGMDKAALDDLKKSIPIARRQPLYFALCIGSKTEETALILDRKIKPDVLKRKAKKMGSGKVGCGTAQLNGKEMVLSCTELPPGGSEKRLKTFFKWATGDNFQVTIVEVADLPELDDEPQEAAQDADEKQGQKEQPPEQENAVLKQAEAVLAKMGGRITAAEEKNAKARQPIEKLVTDIRQSAKDNDAPAVKKRLNALAELLARVLGGSQDEGKLSLVKLGKARIEWPTTRSDARSEMDRLKKKIAEEYQAMPEAKGAVDAALSRLDASLARLTDALDKELDDVLNGDEQSRPERIAKAKSTLAGFISHVDSDPILKELDGNDILSDVEITAPLKAKLGEISAALGR